MIETVGKESLPEIFCDLNAGATLGTFRLTNGSFEDLDKIGLTVDAAVGKRFLFNGGDDTDEDGMLADVCFVGTIINDPTFGYLAKVAESGIFWRRK